MAVRFVGTDLVGVLVLESARPEAFPSTAPLRPVMMR